MKLKTQIFLLIAISSFSFFTAVAQKPRAAAVKPVEAIDPSPLASSPTYAELLLKKTELSSELESLVLEFTEDFPKVKEIRHVVALLDRDIARLAKVKTVDAGKLTLALGKLMLRRIELETDVWNLQRNYKDEHPDVKRARRKVEIYETAISDILN